MNLLTWVLVGCFCGWLTSLLLRINQEADLRMNLVVGMVGAIVAGIYVTPYFGIVTINQKAFSLPSMLVALGGAVVLLLGVYVFRRIRTRAN